MLSLYSLHCFFFTDTATTEIYTLSLHDALPIFAYCVPKTSGEGCTPRIVPYGMPSRSQASGFVIEGRSEEHTSELQSRLHLVCRLLLEKKKKKNNKSEEIYPYI